MKVLIFGATGLLGKSLMREWKGDEVIGLGSSDADIRDASQVQEQWEARVRSGLCSPRHTPMSTAAKAIRPGIRGESRWRSERGRRLQNNPARTCCSSAPIMCLTARKHLRTRPDDSRNPQSVYGRTKAEAEVRLLEILPECCIARTSWLFGPGGKCFPDTILKLAADPARARCGQRSARMPDLFSGSGESDHEPCAAQMQVELST